MGCWSGAQGQSSTDTISKVTAKLHPAHDQVQPTLRRHAGARRVAMENPGPKGGGTKADRRRRNGPGGLGQAAGECHPKSRSGSHHLLGFPPPTLKAHPTDPSPPQSPGKPLYEHDLPGFPPLGTHPNSSHPCRLCARGSPCIGCTRARRCAGTRIGLPCFCCPELHS